LRARVVYKSNTFFVALKTLDTIIKIELN
jgi:hypothetical protein